MKKDRRKCWKKKYDSSPQVKSRRKFRFQAKLRDDMYKEATAGPKVGTYKSGVAVDSGAPEKVNKSRKRKERALCDCGGDRPHKNRNSQYCKYGKQSKTDADRPKDTSIAKNS